MWYREIAWIEPLEAAARMADLRDMAWLDSAMAHPELGRTSMVSADPFGTFRVIEGTAFWNGEPMALPPLEALRACLALYPVEGDGTTPSPGAIGGFHYEFGWTLDRGPGATHNQAAGETARFGFYDTAAIFDHGAKRCWVAASGWPAATSRARAERAAARLAFFAHRLARRAQARTGHPIALRWHASAPPEAYEAGVATVRDYIRAGDIYQANISQKFTAAVPPGNEPLWLYAQLRAANAAPFAALLCWGHTAVLSSSPERLLRLSGCSVETRPIKGTARRLPDPEDDAAAARALLASHKDRAENIMIVDLLRNDLSRVCEPASVAVPSLCALETYASVHHLVSVVTGRLRAGLDALDLVAATFPGGSITGAPKLRAMEIIAEVEREPRGLYCGAIGILGFDGGADLNIAIRTMVIEDGVATVRTGGGITILSDPRAEYRETLDKAQRIFDAFDTTVPA